MTSKIKVDTIEEKTSANGISIDGLTLHMMCQEQTAQHRKTLLMV